MDSSLQVSTVLEVQEVIEDSVLFSMFTGKTVLLSNLSFADLNHGLPFSAGVILNAIEVIFCVDTFTIDSDFVDI